MCRKYRTFDLLAPLKCERDRCMDTVYIFVDSVLESISKSWWKDSNWWIAFTSLAAVIIALVVAWYTKQQVKRESRREIHASWDKKFDDRKRFWEEIKAAYNSWLGEIHCNSLDSENHPPKSLVELVWQAGKPPILCKDFRFQENTWGDLSDRCTRKPQTWLRDFCVKVYPPSSASDSIILSRSTHGKEGYEGFHASRSSLANEFDRQAETDLKYMCGRFGESQYPLIILLCWLEVPLAASTQAIGPGKRALSRLAIKVDRRFGGKYGS